MTVYFAYRPTGTEEERGFIFMNQLWTQPFQPHLRDRFAREVRPWLHTHLGGGTNVSFFTGKTRKTAYRWAVNHAGDVWINPGDADTALEFRLRWC